MPATDYGIISNFKGIGAAMRQAQAEAAANELQQLKIAQSLGGGDAPAAIQIANEYAKARASGDTQRMNDIAMAAKSFDKGVMVNQEGAFNPLQGYGQAVGIIEAAKTGMKQQAEKNVDLQMSPQIKYAETRAGEMGRQRGEKETLYTSSLSRLPQLNKTVEALSDLGNKASYTYGGRATDTLARQVGFTTDTAAARAEYISKVDNEVLPLLRDTFGAAFTQKEGESLKATLGAPNMSPREKDAVLRSFISSKYDTLESMGREIGQTPALPDKPTIGVEPPINYTPPNIPDLQPLVSVNQSKKIGSIPMQAVKDLKANPSTAAAFDEVFGKGASKGVLGR